MHQQKETQHSIDEAKIAFYLKFINYLMDQIRLHGLSFIMLTIAVMWFYKENTKLAQEIKGCNSTMMQIYRDDKVRTEALISKNTEAFEANTEAFHQLKTYFININMQ